MQVQTDRQCAGLQSEGVVKYTEHSVRHLAFFEALAELRETDAAWRATTAGLVVLRLIDSWFDEALDPRTDGAWSMNAVREAVGSIDAGNPARNILSGTLDALEDAPRVSLGAVAPRLLAYGRSLDYEGQWLLSADVYRSVIARADPAEDADVAADAYLQLGYCMRTLGLWDEAAKSFGIAGRIASQAGDIMKVLRGRLAEAKLALVRGNLPEAEALLDETIDRAHANRLFELRAQALHDRATVAHARRDFQSAIRFGYDALRGLTNPTARDRALSDIASAFAELGVWSAARDAHLVLAATAQEQYVRWIATINLLELAALDRREPVFEQYRRQLSDIALPPVLEANFHLYVGEGYRIFGKLEAARASLTRAHQIAAGHKLNQLAFRAEDALRSLDVQAPAPVRPLKIVPDSVRHVAEAMGQLRDAAGIGV